MQIRLLVMCGCWLLGVCISDVSGAGLGCTTCQIVLQTKMHSGWIGYEHKHCTNVGLNMTFSFKIVRINLGEITQS